jgi:urease accessory protein
LTKPTDLLDGLLSGLGHPVIGIDHMAFVLALGVAAGFTHSGFRIPSAFIASSMLGITLHLTRGTMPYPEAMVALSLVAIGVVFLMRRHLPWPRGWLAFAVAAGIIHGYVYADAIVEAEPIVRGSFLVGLAVSQALLALVSKAFVDIMLHEDQAIRGGVRVVGGVLVAVGVAFLAVTLQA